MWSGRCIIRDQPTTFGCTPTATAVAPARAGVDWCALAPDVPHAASPPASTPAAMTPAIPDAQLT
jgi:hypothetical protein